jgi:hypothetical protein
LFLFKPSVTELLLRRSLPALCRSAFLARDEACLLQADSTASVTPCCTRPLGEKGDGGRSAASDVARDERAKNGERADDKPSAWVLDVIGRICAPFPQCLCECVPMLSRGSAAFCVSGGSTTERRRKTPTVTPTFLLIIFTAATLSSPRVLGGCELGGRRGGSEGSSRCCSNLASLCKQLLAKYAGGECAST